MDGLKSKLFGCVQFLYRSGATALTLDVIKAGGKSLHELRMSAFL